MIFRQTLALVLLAAALAAEAAGQCPGPNCPQQQQWLSYPTCRMRWCQNPLHWVTYQPAVRAVEEKPVLHSTPQTVVAKALRIACPKVGEVLYDLGCGDGRVLVMGSEKYGLDGVGIEINTATANLARQNIREAGLNNIRIVEGDATKYKLDKADLVFFSLPKNEIPKLHETLSQARVVISYQEPIPQLPTQQVTFTAGGGKHKLFIYRRD